jgi:cytochrome P450
LASDTTLGRIVAVRKTASFLRLIRNPLDFFRTVASHSGSLAEISLGGRRFFVLNDPELIRDIFATHGSQFEKFPPGNPKQKLFGKGLLTSEGPAQKAQRRILLPGFHRDRLSIYANHMVDLVEGMSALWQPGQAVDIAAFMNRLTLRVIGRSLLGIEDNVLLAELGVHLATMLHLVNRFVMPWGDLLMRIPLPSSLRYRAASKHLERMISELIARAKESPGDNLLGVLLAARHADGSQLSGEEIRDEIVTMIVAGHETVAVGLTWCLDLLARNPAVQSDLAARTIAALGDRRPVVEHYAELGFLQQAFSESLRLYPPIWIMGRRALESYSFEDFDAPAGSVFLVCMADLHRRAEFFAEPENFLPDRWQNPTWPTYAFIPFGAGDRRCIGERFAWMEGIFFLACLLRRWEFAPSGAEPVPSPQLTLHPRGPVWLKLAPRTYQADDRLSSFTSASQ